MNVKRIEVEFAVPVNLTNSDMKEISNVISTIAKNNTPEGMVHWLFGFGAKPRYSQNDCIFLDKPVDYTAPLDGEPTYDNETFYIETACRDK